MKHKLVLPSHIRSWLQDPKTTLGHKRKNVYTCLECSNFIVTIDTDKGVTPFMVSCHAKEGCGGLMVSGLYSCSQTLTPQFEWVRPEFIDGMDPVVLEHVLKGGLVLRPIGEHNDERIGPPSD